MYNEDNTKILKKDVQDWLGTMYFSHYLVIDLPLNRKHYEFDQATEFFKIVIKRFEKELVGRHWNKKPVHFIGIAELGDFHIWHLNLLLWSFQYTDEQLQTAVTKTSKYMNLDKGVMDIQPIEYTRYRLNGYNSKELKSDDKFHMDSNRIFSSDMLFYL